MWTDSFRKLAIPLTYDLAIISPLGALPLATVTLLEGFPCLLCILQQTRMSQALAAIVYLAKFDEPIKKGVAQLHFKESEH